MTDPDDLRAELAEIAEAASATAASRPGPRAQQRAQRLAAAQSFAATLDTIPDTTAQEI